jgi:hypothetical protein
MRSTSQVLWCAIAVVLGCKGDPPEKVPLVVEKMPPGCEVVTTATIAWERAIAVLAGSGDTDSIPRRIAYDELGKAMTESCEKKKWSAKARTCLADTKTASEGFGCLGELSEAEVMAFDDVLSPPPPPPPPPGIPRNIPPTELEGRRTAGDKAITPDAATAAAIAKSKKKVVASFNMCIDANGAVAAVTVLKSSGFPAYDKRIETTMRDTWKYKPADPVCTAVTFIYTAR